MGKFRIKIEELAEIHIKKHIKSGNKVLLKKLEKILIELQETPYSDVVTVFVIAALGHYSDK